LTKCRDQLLADLDEQYSVQKAQYQVRAHRPRSLHVCVAERTSRGSQSIARYQSLLTRVEYPRIVGGATRFSYTRPRLVSTHECTTPASGCHWR
jgi:hypothetical protein